MEFHFLWWFKVPILLLMGPKQFLKLHDCPGLIQTIWTSLCVVFYLSKTSCSTKQWLNNVHVHSWTFLTFLKLPKQFQKPSHCHSTSTCVSVQLLFVCCSVVNIHDICLVVCYTWSYHMSLLFVAGVNACVSDDQLLVFSAYIFHMGNFVPCETHKV